MQYNMCNIITNIIWNFLVTVVEISLKLCSVCLLEYNNLSCVHSKHNYMGSDWYSPAGCSYNTGRVKIWSIRFCWTYRLLKQQNIKLPGDQNLNIWLKKILFPNKILNIIVHLKLSNVLLTQNLCTAYDIW